MYGRCIRTVVDGMRFFSPTVLMLMDVEIYKGVKVLHR